MSDETPKRRGPIKPAEFLRQLESDPAWVARRDARDGIARALAVPEAEPLAWEAMVALFRRIPPDSRAKQGAAVALANMASERTIHELVQLALEDQHGSDRVLFVTGLARFDGPRVEEALRHLLQDSVIGKGARLELRRLRHPLGRFRPA